MKTVTENFIVSTQGKGIHEITSKVDAILHASRIVTGLATIFVQHTSASLLVYKKGDQTARADLHRFFEELVPENRELLTHTEEGMDDATSHLKMALTRTSESVPVAKGRLQLGNWQGLYLFEHLNGPHLRTVSVNVLGMC
jgi:secondary thiamine-phosphate synthase enzyme